MLRALVLSAFPLSLLQAGGLIHAQMVEVRGNLAAGDLARQVSKRQNWGLGYMADLGSGPVFLRFRLDADGFDGAGNNGPVEGLGAGLGLVCHFPEWHGWVPFVAAGPVYQHWSVAQDAASPPLLPWTVNRLAARFQAGLWFSPHTGVSLGVLTGALDARRTATTTFLAVSRSF